MMSKNQRTGFRITADTVGEYSPLASVRRLLAYVRPYKWMAVSAVILSFFSSALLVLRPYMIKVAIDSYITPENLDGLSKYMMLFIIVYLLRFLAGYMLNRSTGILGQYVMHDLRMKIFSHILSMEMSFFDRNRVGRLMTRTTDDVNALNELYTSGAIRILNNSTIIVGIVFMMFFMDWKLSLVTLSILPLLFIAARLFATKIRVIYRRIRKGTARLNAFLQESIQGMRIIQIMQRTSWSHKKFSSYSEELMDAKILNVFYYGWFFPIMEFVGTLGLVLIISASGMRIEHGTLTIGIMVAFMRLVEMFFWPVRELAENFNVMLSAIAASERIFTLLDTEPTIKDTAGNVDNLKNPEITFDHVWFAYNNEEWILKDISFTVSSGEKVAFAGPSGAGKTSIISLLMRFYEVNKGRILINGTDIRDIPLEDLRGLIAYVGQEAFLFNRSVIDNVSLGNPAIKTDQVENIFDRMCDRSCFDDLEDGLNTNVRERGSRLSQGQRQLVSFARALSAERQILVLDEATSSVDTFTENLLQKAVPVLMEGRTSIVIAHRLSTIRNVDRVHVIARGRIRETGTHDELMALDGLYARLSKMHFG